MLKVLLKKQFAEAFRSFFYDGKKNRLRSKGGTAGMILFFAVLMVGILGGAFTFLSLGLCGSLVQAGMGWLYFLLMGGIAVVLGAFGSVFNTYSGLYRSKDNDLLLSLPIPVRTIMTARLINVYLMGVLYAATALLPALIVYWAVAGGTVSRVICGILLFLITTVIVLVLSCLLGWVVARISLKLKNKSVITVIISLAFIAGYYVLYFKANILIRDIVRNAESYGERIRGAAYALYLYGRVGEGDWLAALICAAVTAVLLALVWTVLSRSFLKIATAGGTAKKARYTEKPVRPKTVSGALITREFARFTSSPNYMLNCGLGVLLIPVSGVLLLARGSEAAEVLGAVFAGKPGCVEVLICAALCLMASMNDMAAPAVSLEGKNLWIAQSLPVSPRKVLHAKASVQMILTAVPLLFAGACACLAVSAMPAARVLLFVTPLAFAAFSALFGTVIGVRMPLLHWTNETAPVKQSGAVTIAMFSGWAVSIVMAGLYLLVGHRIGAALYLGLWTVLFAAAALLLLRWLDTGGAKEFAAL